MEPMEVETENDKQYEELLPIFKEVYDEAQKSKDWDKQGEVLRFGALKDALNSRKIQASSTLNVFLQRYYAERQHETPSDIRVRDTEYAIADTPYVAIADEMKIMHVHTELLLQWYDDHATKEKYAAPCMPIVQSSGTGKTKLLFEFKFDSEEKQKNYEVKLISCLPRDDRRKQRTRSVYDLYLDFAGQKENFLEANLKDIIDEERPNSKHAIVLIFDEAQQLSRDGGMHMLALRKLLRKKRPNRRPVAFFAGTNQSLANRYPTEEQRKSSREGENTEEYYQCGHELHPPLFELYTMGCLAKKIKFPKDASEFEKSIPYGRPLFARMLLDEAVDGGKMTWPVEMKHTISENEMAIVATRLFWNHHSPFENSETLLPFASVWATRVQLGGVSTAVVETLVAKGYAHLTSFQANRVTSSSQSLPQPTVSFANLPDPVVARLAMCVMEEGWSLTAQGGDVIKGKSKTAWTDKLKLLFSSGLCRPSRGDLGEVVSAAYLLMCGDVLRYEKDRNFFVFSVPVSEWFSLLENPFAKRGSSDDEVTANADTWMDSQPLINFIQFCRNNLRYGLEDVCRKSFLEYIYNSCCAVYAYEGATNIDGYAAIKCLDGAGETQYAPLVISIKTRDGYTEGAAKKNIDSITKDLVRINQNCALILVILLDRDAFGIGGDDIGDGQEEIEAEESDASLGSEHEQAVAEEEVAPSHSSKKQKTSCWQVIADSSLTAAIAECGSKIVSRIVSIPANDPFNLTDVARGATRSWEESSVFDSHCFAGIAPVKELCGGRKKDRGTVKSVLLSDATDSLQKKLSMLWIQRHELLREGNDETEAMDTHAS